MIKSIVRRMMPTATWTRLSGIRWAIDKRIERWKTEADLVGLTAAFALVTMPNGFVQVLRGLRADHRVRSLRVKGFDHPLFYRTGTSDPDVVRQIFIDKQYECVGSEEGVNLIIDCGANIGCSSFYFLHRYPNAHVIAVEPDPQNFALCCRNLAPFGDRVTLINSGIWSVPTPLKIERGRFGDRLEWAVKVRPAGPGDTPDLIATTIDQLMNERGFDLVDILKIDIEGSEVTLFSEGVDRWLPRTRHLAIELHGPECDRAFQLAMSEYSSNQSQHGEVLLCKDLYHLISNKW